MPLTAVTPRDDNKQHPLNLIPSLMQDCADPMEIDDQSEESSSLSSRESRNVQRFRQQLHVPSGIGYHTSPTTRSQRRRHNRIERLKWTLRRQAAEVQEKNDEVRDLKSKLEQMERKNMRLSIDNADLRYDICQCPQAQVSAQSEKTPEMLDDTVIKDLISHASEASEHNHALQETLNRVELEKTQLLSECEERISENQELARKDSGKLENEIRKLHTENDELRLHHAKLNANLERAYEERNLLQGQLQVITSEQEQLQAKNKTYLREKSWYNKNFSEMYEVDIVPWAKERNMNDLTLSMPYIRAAVANMAQDSLEVGMLRNKVQSATQQVSALQQELLSNIEKVEVISDEQFTQQFQSLAALVKTFSRTAIPLPTASGILAVGDILNATLNYGVDPAYWTTSIRKKFLIEAFVWSVLWDSLFSEACKYST